MASAQAAQPLDHDKYFDAHPEPCVTHEIAVALAYEGVPVRAIARSIKTPGEEVYEILKEALNDGKLIELPRDDWPTGARRERTPSERKMLQLDDVMIQTVCSSLFKLTRLQAAVFCTIVKRPNVTKEQLHQAIENTRSANQEPTDQKMVDVVICHIRKKIRAHDLAIETLWGIGYFMDVDQRSRVLHMLDQHMQETGL